MVEDALRAYAQVAADAGLLTEPAPDVARAVALRRDAAVREATRALGAWEKWPLHRRRVFVRLLMEERSKA